ncbi:MAG TPA: hypothetical protein VEZ90_02620, partial [Blastocatellia bacterium]|nr:hypothetical protein [Blastocatellia bacterium]
MEIANGTHGSQFQGGLILRYSYARFCVGQSLTWLYSQLRRYSLAGALMLGPVLCGHWDPVGGNANVNDPQDRTMPSGPATENRAQAAETQKVMLAEAACANMLSRLHDTLDFQTLFDEMWARDPVFKERFRRNNFEQFKTRVSYDPQLTEHVIASTFSTLYLLFQYDT